MQRLQRTLLQVLFWAVVWGTIAMTLEDPIPFFTRNWLTYVFQILLIICIVYLLASKLLFQKKYITFILVAIGLTVGSSYITSQLFNQDVPEIRQGPREMREEPPEMRPEPPEMRSGPPEMRPGPPGPKPPGPKPPSHQFIQLILLGIALITATGIELFLFASRKEEALLLSKTENLKTELKLLKAQINPHFLFNSLNNIYALSVIDADKTQQSISYLSDMLRYVLYECEQPLVAIKKEITYVQNYINLFALKSSRNYNITTNFTNINGDFMIAPMLCIPFVENAFKHSDIDTSKDAYITIGINQVSDGIIFIVENSVPSKTLQKDAFGGIGIINVKKRLSILYPDTHTLTIDETDKNYSVTLKLFNDV